MSSIPKELRYTKEHEWARMDDDGFVEIGITDFAQDAMGAIVFVELPKEGDVVQKDEPFGTIESTKSVSDLFAPISGKVVEVNDAVVESPDILNDDPYEEGWLIRIKPAGGDEFDELLDANEYDEFLGELEEE